MQKETSGLTLLDGHVHIHDCFELPWLLDGSYRNFAGEAERQDRSARFEGVLLLTETANAHWFQKLTELADQNLAVKCADGASWQFARTGEDCSVAANRSTGERLILVAGRQIVTAERLEVLAIATARTFPDGEPISEVLNSVLEAGAIPVVPWGFGKWLGGRGRVVREIVEHPPVSPFFLGDNANRLRWSRLPEHFKQARRRDIEILPGSDPLPFPSEAGRAGSFGFCIAKSIGTDTPGAKLKEFLTSNKPSVHRYGRLESPSRFLKHQITIQVNKFLREKLHYESSRHCSAAVLFP